jgi:hypothetical protein
MQLQRRQPSWFLGGLFVGNQLIILYLYSYFIEGSGDKHEYTATRNKFEPLRQKSRRVSIPTLSSA